VADHQELVTTPVTNHVTVERSAVPVSLLVRSAVDIHSVCYLATKRVLPVSKDVHGLVSTKSLAPCPVPLLATGYHAINAVRENFPAVISAQESVVRPAPNNTATNVA
jgi:hypothetical protein